MRRWPVPRSQSRPFLRPSKLQNSRHCLRLHTQVPLRRQQQKPLQSSYSSYALVAVLACAGTIAFDYYTQNSTPVKPEPELESETEPEPKPEPSAEVLSNDNEPDYSNMPIPSGHLGNVSLEQEQKLREFWAITLKTFGVHDQDPSRPQTIPARPTTAESAPVQETVTPKKHSKKLSLFSRNKESEPSSPSSPRASMDDDDKYGQAAQLRQILASTTPESLRAAFWAMVKADHPDALLLRFLRARKWDVDKALAMLVSTMHWRSQEMHVDDDIMLNGEEGAHLDERSSDASAKREGHDFLAQLRMGKSFLHGIDKEGRPITYVRARLHKGGEQTEKSLERYTVYTIETARLALKPPVETACIIFDMTSFSMANMDYGPVKFMIKVFEANYPESLGAVLIHKAPWIFQGIWKIIRGWLDPVVAAKVSFTNNVEELEAFMPRSQIIKELGGNVNWEFKYFEPVAGENDLMKDTRTRDQLQEARRADVVGYQQKTFDWIAGSTQAKRERDVVAEKLYTNYWQLDPYIRARSVYDRVGYIGRGGKIDFFPTNELKSTNGIPVRLANADDLD